MTVGRAEERQLRERELAAQQAQQQAQQAFMIALAGQGMGGANATSQTSEAFLDIVNPTRGKFGIAPRVNPDADKAAGLILPAQYGLFGDLTSVDITNAKNKITSGMDNNDEQEIVFKEIWPNQFLNRMLCGQLKYHQLDHLRFSLGMIQKMFCDMPPACYGTSYHNMTRVTIMLLKLALHCPWTDVLEVGKSLFQALERRTLTWLSWPDIQLWWEDAMTTMTYKRVGGGNPSNPGVPGNPGKRPAADAGQPPPAKVAKNAMYGVPHAVFKEKNICKKFNLGRCSTPAPHASPANASILLRHVCAGCVVLKKGEDGGHGMNVCPNKPSSGIFA